MERVEQVSKNINGVVAEAAQEVGEGLGQAPSMVGDLVSNIRETGEYVSISHADTIKRVKIILLVAESLVLGGELAWLLRFFI